MHLAHPRHSFSHANFRRSATYMPSMACVLFMQSVVFLSPSSSPHHTTHYSAYRKLASTQRPLTLGEQFLLAKINHISKSSNAHKCVWIKKTEFHHISGGLRKIRGEKIFIPKLRYLNCHFMFALIWMFFNFVHDLKKKETLMSVELIKNPKNSCTTLFQVIHLNRWGL